MRSVLALVVATLATSCAEAPAALPPPVAQRQVKWQQFCEQAWNVPQASALVAARGADGWELVALYNGALCYKRPVPEAARAARVAPTSAGPPVFLDPGF
jgi:hypothetical protein